MHKALAMYLTRADTPISFSNFSNILIKPLVMIFSRISLKRLELIIEYKYIMLYR